MVGYIGIRARRRRTRFYFFIFFFIIISIIIYFFNQPTAEKEISIELQKEKQTDYDLLLFEKDQKITIRDQKILNLQNEINSLIVRINKLNDKIDSINTNKEEDIKSINLRNTNDIDKLNSRIKKLNELINNLEKEKVNLLEENNNYSRQLKIIQTQLLSSENEKVDLQIKINLLDEKIQSQNEKLLDLNLIIKELEDTSHHN